MTASPTDAPEPAATFDQIPLAADVRQAVDDLGYVTPTPVQLAVFEPAARGRDLVVQARTGTGKTAAFGLPLANTLVRRGTRAVQALVLCPTRELAIQVSQEVEALSKHRGLSAVAVYGGAPMQRQIDQLRDGAQILVGTPGRVLDHLRRGTLDTAQVRVLILDESDEMLSMGFLPQINEILAFLPANRQTLLFSATLPPAVTRMAETRLRDPEFVTLSGDQIGALEVEHLVYWSHGDKTSEFLTMLEAENPESAIVFCNTRDQTRRVASALQQRGFTADWINSDLAQSDREKVMEATRNGELRFLVATDVASRGIDISHLTHVLNFDFPDSAEAYVHRTGRTGRAGRTGTAISMVTPGDVGSLYLVRLTYGIRPDARHVPSARELRTRAEADLVSMLGRTFEERPIRPEDLALARRVLTEDRGVLILASLLRDHLGDGPEAPAEATRARRATRARPAATPRLGHAPQRRARREQRLSADAAAIAEESAPPSATTPVAAEPAPEPTAAAEEPTAAADGLVTADPSRPRRRRDRGRSGRARDAREEPRSGGDRAHWELDDDLPGYTVEGEPPADLESREGPPEDDPEVLEIFVSVGRRDGAESDDFYALLDDAELGAGVDSVNVRQRHTFVRVRRAYLQRVVEALDGRTISGRIAQAEPARSTGGPQRPD